MFSWQIDIGWAVATITTWRVSCVSSVWDGIEKEGERNAKQKRNDGSIDWSTSRWKKNKSHSTLEIICGFFGDWRLLVEGEVVKKRFEAFRIFTHKTRLCRRHRFINENPQPQNCFSFHGEKKKCSYPPSPPPEHRMPPATSSFQIFVLLYYIGWKGKMEKIYPTMLCTILWKMFSEMGVEASNGIKRTFWQILRRNGGEGRGAFSRRHWEKLWCVCLFCVIW